MADEQLIKPRELPAATAVFADDAIMTDDGVTVAKATPVQIVDAGAPVPSQSEAIAGVDNSKRMTPLTVRHVLDNTSAPAVLRAQAWAESATTPDPSMPGSKSSRTWALEAEQSASDAEDAASTAATDTANLITATMQGYVDSASGSASAAAESEDNAAISAGQAATSAGQAVAAMAGSVRFDQAQTLTSGQKQQAAENIAAVSYDAEQTLTSTQQSQGRSNIGASAFGVGQAWYDVTGSRAANTIYQNTTGKPIGVAVNLQRDTVEARYLQVSSDNGATWASLGRSSATEAVLANTFGVVPDGHWYRVTGTFTVWNEMRD